MAQGKCLAESRPLMIGKNRGTSTAVLYRPRCKLWSCSHCAETNRGLWAIRIYNGVENYMNKGLIHWSFLTWTTRGNDRGLARSLAAWRKAWPKLSSRMRRRWPGFRYVVLPEQHKDGTVHTHMLASAPIPKRYAKDVGHAVGLGFMNDSQPLESAKKSSYYVVKYVGKSLGVEQWPHKLRRVRTSQRWPKLEFEFDTPDIDLEWSMIRHDATYEDAEVLREFFKGNGYENVRIISK